jgi:hypothetical protein
MRVLAKFFIRVDTDVVELFTPVYIAEHREKKEPMNRIAS